MYLGDKNVISCNLNSRPIFHKPRFLPSHFADRVQIFRQSRYCRRGLTIEILSRNSAEFRGWKTALPDCFFSPFSRNLYFSQAAWAQIFTRHHYWRRGLAIIISSQNSAKNRKSKSACQIGFLDSHFMSNCDTHLKFTKMPVA